MKGDFSRIDLVGILFVVTYLAVALVDTVVTGLLIASGAPGEEMNPFVNVAEYHNEYPKELVLSSIFAAALFYFFRRVAIRYSADGMPMRLSMRGIVRGDRFAFGMLVALMIATVFRCLATIDVASIYFFRIELVSYWGIFLFFFPQSLVEDFSRPVQNTIVGLTAHLFLLVAVAPLAVFLMNRLLVLAVPRPDGARSGTATAPGKP